MTTMPMNMYSAEFKADVDPEHHHVPGAVTFTSTSEKGNPMLLPQLIPII